MFYKQIENYNNRVPEGGLTLKLALWKILEITSRPKDRRVKRETADLTAADHGALFCEDDRNSRRRRLFPFKILNLPTFPDSFYGRWIIAR